MHIDHVLLAMSPLLIPLLYMAILVIAELRR